MTLALLLTAVTGAWATEFTSLKVGDVLHVGDVINTSTTYRVCGMYLQASFQPATLVRGDISAKSVTESETGAYYILKDKDGYYYGLINGDEGYEGGYWPVTDTSDGISVTAIIPDNYTELMFAVHEGPAPAGYTVTLAEGTEDADKWTISPAKGLKGGETVTATYGGEKKVKSVKAVKVGGEIDPLAVPLTIEAITAGIISIEKPKVGMQYSLNGGAKTTMTGTTTFEVAAGDKVQFYGNGTTITSYGASKISGCTTITGISGMGFTCKVYGNIMSLVDEENFATAKTLSATYTFRNLFNGNVYLTDASGLLLPATELASNCYYQMFYGCTALTAAPALPATQLASYCYQQMFYNCSALTAAPELPATELASNCYYQMFRGCTALTAAPELPAPTLVSNCYDQMFYGCSKLATVTCLATSGMNMSKSTSSWLDGAGSQVDGTKTFNAVSTANWPSGANGIPTGWTRVNIDN